MTRVTINMDEPDFRLVKQQADRVGKSLSAYCAEAAHKRALAESYQAAAAAERDYPPTDEELARDAKRIVAKHAAERGAVPGAAA